MGNWSETHYAVDHQGRRSVRRKPPLDNRQSCVPSWEKKFCSSVGSVSWKKLLESKRYMCLHNHVMQWDDSACKQAFNNAKIRFWAEMNGLPCYISLPDPNIYIDDVDWDASSVDPELLLDLEKQRNRITEVAENGEPVIFNDILQLNQSVACTGWGDAETDLSNGKCNDIENWHRKCNLHVDGDVNRWEEYCIQTNCTTKEYNKWGDGWDGWNQWEVHHDDKHQKMEDRAYGNWRTCQGHNKKKFRFGWQAKTSNLRN